MERKVKEHAIQKVVDLQNRKSIILAKEKKEEKRILKNEKEIQEKIKQKKEDGEEKRKIVISKKN